MVGWLWALFSVFILFQTILLVDKFTNIIMNPSYENSDCFLVYLKFGKNYSLVNFHGKLLHTLNADHNPRKRIKYLRGRVPSASFNIELLRASDIEPNPGNVRNPCSVCSKPIAKTHQALCCSTCYLYSHIKCGDVTPMAYCEIKAMSNYHWVSRFCKIRSAMPFSVVEDVDFLQLFQDGEKSINNQDWGCQNGNIANDSNSASWYKENIRSHYKFNLTIYLSSPSKRQCTCKQSR